MLDMDSDELPCHALWLFVPDLAGVGVCHLVSKKVGMLETEATNL